VLRSRRWVPARAGADCYGLRISLPRNATKRFIMTQPDSEAVSFTVRLPRETADRLREIAASESRSVAAELRRAVQAHVDRASQGSKPGRR
jgi:hypothetical protein